MKSFLLEIVTPQRVAYSDSCDMVVVPSASGAMGILSRHTPLFAELTEGELKIEAKGETYYLAIGGGFVEVRKDKVTVLVTRAVHARELNEAEIARARKQAEESLTVASSDQDRAVSHTLLRQSIVDMQVLRRMRRRH
ncbi:MAG: ATP synthase F1 subunit epsilon [bacterium]|nr:ATP synthase F1 subunit epsilon [bacterium]